MAEDTKTTEQAADAKSSTTASATTTEPTMKDKMIKYGVPVVGAVAGAFAGRFIAKKYGKNKMVFMVIGLVAGGAIGYFASTKMANK